MQFNISYKYQSIYKEKNYGVLLEAKILLRENTYSIAEKKNLPNEDHKMKDTL